MENNKNTPLENPLKDEVQKEVNEEITEEVMDANNEEAGEVNLEESNLNDEGQQNVSDGLNEPAGGEYTNQFEEISQLSVQVPATAAPAKKKKRLLMAPIVISIVVFVVTLLAVGGYYMFFDKSVAGVWAVDVYEEGDQKGRLILTPDESIAANGGRAELFYNSSAEVGEYQIINTGDVSTIAIKITSNSVFYGELEFSIEGNRIFGKTLTLSTSASETSMTLEYVDSSFDMASSIDVKDDFQYRQELVGRWEFAEEDGYKVIYEFTDDGRMTATTVFPEEAVSAGYPSERVMSCVYTSTDSSVEIFFITSEAEEGDNGVASYVSKETSTVLDYEVSGDTMVLGEIEFKKAA